MNAVKTIEQIRARAEEIASDATHRFPAAASPGDTWRQGDIYITLLDKLPSGAKRIANPIAQLAPGTTQGSRHLLDSLDGVEQYTSAPTALDGPVLLLHEERTITHPEHGNVICGSGIYAITYQRAFAEELRRVAD